MFSMLLCMKSFKVKSNTLKRKQNSEVSFKAWTNAHYGTENEIPNETIKSFSTLIIKAAVFGLLLLVVLKFGLNSLLFLYLSLLLYIRFCLDFSAISSCLITIQVTGKMSAVSLDKLLYFKKERFIFNFCCEFYGCIWLDYENPN